MTKRLPATGVRANRWTGQKGTKVIIWLMDHPEVWDTDPWEVAEELVTLGIYTNPRSMRDYGIQVKRYLEEIAEYYKGKAVR